MTDTEQTEARPLQVRVPLTAYLEAEIVADLAAVTGGDADASPVRVIGRQIVVEHAGGEARFALPEGEFEVVAGGRFAGALQRMTEAGR